MGAVATSLFVADKVDKALNPDIPKVPGVNPPTQDKTEVEKAKADARRRARGLAVGGFGRSDTILTGPLGLPGSPPGGNKTLLGG